VRAPRGRASGESAAPALQGITRRRTGDTQSGNETEKQASDDGDGSGEEKNSAIHADAFHAWKNVWSEYEDGTDAVVGDSETQAASEYRESQTFRKKLSDQAGATGAERRANGHFTSPHASTRELQVGYVYDSDEQDESDGTEKNQQPAAHVPDEQLFQGNGDRVSII
jgi:hypothetical protein